MARYSRRRKSAFTFTLPGSFATITDMSITRVWDDGELLILAKARMRNDSLVTAQVDIRVVIDGIAVSPIGPGATIVAGATASVADVILQPNNAGAHTIALEGQSTVTPDVIVLGASAQLIVIQLQIGRAHV